MPNYCELKSVFLLKPTFMILLTQPFTFMADF